MSSRPLSGVRKSSNPVYVLPTVVGGLSLPPGGRGTAERWKEHAESHGARRPALVRFVRVSVSLSVS